MSVNLIEMAKGLFSTEAISAISNTLKESDSSIVKAIDAFIPSIFKGLLDKAATPTGAKLLTSMAEEQSEHNIFDNVTGRLGDENEAGFLKLGSGMFNTIFDGPATGMINASSNYAGVKPSSASSLLSLTVPAIMSFLGNYIKNNKENSSDFAALLHSQKDNIAAAMPAGFNPTHLFESNEAKSTAVPTMHAAASAAHGHATHTVPAMPTNYEDSDVDEKKSALCWLIPVLFLALLAAAALYFFKPSEDAHAGNREHANTHGVQEPTGDAPTSAAASTTATMGSLDSSGNFVYNTGNRVNIDLPNNGGSLSVGENSTEAKLVRFLQSSEAVDTVKGNWFEFTNVRFNTGKSTITEESIQQLKNMVAISKAFPQAKFKIGGYTDNTGNADFNLNLSKERAAAVLQKLKELGAAGSSLTGSDGYGDQFPVASNSTDEGRAQNRRVSVNVKAK